MFSTPASSSCPPVLPPDCPSPGSEPLLPQDLGLAPAPCLAHAMSTLQAPAQSQALAPACALTWAPGPSRSRRKNLLARLRPQGPT
ncbi:hypothetical protein COCON_G00151240 [Conger conger]|uniref:Uncharacterized protein n=1 Tax=Conger conger TaxID=82655 RepID=A0A9Q1D878_CONCO|nr:hypothetical protein COCON_G00151240 [Conger conger]